MDLCRWNSVEGIFEYKQNISIEILDFPPIRLIEICEVWLKFPSNFKYLFWIIAFTCSSLFKWGGTYLDLDVIVKQNLDHYKNYAGAESITNVAAGMMNFDSDATGRHMALECLQ